jgi:hypothetical protein
MTDRRFCYCMPLLFKQEDDTQAARQMQNATHIMIIVVATVENDLSTARELDMLVGSGRDEAMGYI